MACHTSTNHFNEFSTMNAKPVPTPMQPRVELMKEQAPLSLTQEWKIWGVPYSKAIRCILWPAIISQPDITFTTRIQSQFIQNLDAVHLEALKQAIVYLGLTSNLWLTFGRRAWKFMQGYWNTDWGSQKHCCSISSYSYHVSQGVVSWSSKKQQIAVLSTIEAKYIMQTHVAREALWLWSFVVELHGENNQPLTIHCDNQGAIALSKDNKFHAQTKHINICHHFIHEAIKDRKITVIYVPTDENPMDIFTKTLTEKNLLKCWGWGGWEGRTRLDHNHQSFATTWHVMHDLNEQNLRGSVTHREPRGKGCVFRQVFMWKS